MVTDINLDFCILVFTYSFRQSINVVVIFYVLNTSQSLVDRRKEGRKEGGKTLSLKKKKEKKRKAGS